MQRYIILAVLLTTACLGSLTAQSAFVPSGSSPATAKADNWSVYADSENNLYYIDFEKLRVNLSSIVLLDGNGKVVFEKEVHHLPVNTIFELDFNSFPEGRYVLELRSYTTTLRENIDFRPRR
jgi:hypothetical protein